MERARQGLYLQIEVNRALYLDEEKIVKKLAFESVKSRLTRVLRTVLAMPMSQLGRPDSLPEAAE